VGVKLKKKAILIITVVLLIISSFLLYDEFSSRHIFNLVLLDKLLIWFITASLFIYYLKMDDDPQLVTASITTDKNNDDKHKDRNKPNVSFTDVAGLDEIKEELTKFLAGKDFEDIKLEEKAKKKTTVVFQWRI